MTRFEFEKDQRYLAAQRMPNKNFKTLPAIAAAFANGTNMVSVPMTNSAQFFRLREPGF